MPLGKPKFEVQEPLSVAILSEMKVHAQGAEGLPRGWRYMGLTDVKAKVKEVRAGIECLSE